MGLSEPSRDAIEYKIALLEREYIRNGESIVTIAAEQRVQEEQKQALKERNHKIHQDVQDMRADLA